MSCAHKNVIPGLDACYCSSCKRWFESWTAEYQRIMGCAGYGSAASLCPPSNGGRDRAAPVEVIPKKSSARKKK